MLRIAGPLLGFVLALAITPANAPQGFAHSDCTFGGRHMIHDRLL
jgi:hypothetical protein